MPLSTACTGCAGLIAQRLGRRRLLGMAGAAGLAAGLPRRARAGEGHYEAMLFTCIDPRFPEPTIKYMTNRQLLGKYSQFSMAGASIGIVAPNFAAWRPAFWENLAASVQLHHIPKVIVVNHRDCGAARIAFGAAQVTDRASETATHKAALADFRTQVVARHPDMKVETSLMALDGTVEMFTA